MSAVVRRKRLYVTVDIDIWPRRLTAAGVERLRDLLRDALDATADIELTTPGRVHRAVWFTCGPSGCYCDRIDKRLADTLEQRVQELLGDNGAYEPARQAA